MTICKYCGANLPKSVTSGHLRRCQPYLESSDRLSKAVPDCICGYHSLSKTIMQKHRKTCESWKSRDAKQLHLERLKSTFMDRFGVDNPMQVESIKQKVESTMADRYGGHIFSKDSDKFDVIVESIKMRSPERRKRVATEKWEQSKQIKAAEKSEMLSYIHLVDFDFKQTTINRSASTHKDFYDKFHYAKFGRSSTAVYEVLLNGTLVAAIKFSSVVRIEVATTLGNTCKEVLELDRFCIHPAYQKKNFASYVMSKVIDLVRHDFPNIKKLVSFADSGQNHAGTIYKASNWKQVGITAPSYIYIDMEGNELNKKTLYGRAKRDGMKEREYAELHKFVKKSTPPKIKFVYEL